MKRLFAAIALGCLPAAAIACSSAPFDPVKDGREANWAVIGYVVGDHYPSYEARILRGEDPTAMEFPEKRTVRVAVVQVLVGESSRIVEAVVPCSIPLEARERVVVTSGRDGFVRLFPADYAEDLLLAALREEP